MMFRKNAFVSNEIDYDKMHAEFWKKSFGKKWFAPFYVPFFSNYVNTIGEILSEQLHRVVSEVARLESPERELFVLSAGECGKIFIEHDKGENVIKLTMSGAISQVSKKVLLERLFKKNSLTAKTVKVFDLDAEELRVVGNVWKMYKRENHGYWSPFVKKALNGQ